MLAEVAWDPRGAGEDVHLWTDGFVEAAAEGLVGLGHDPALVKTERFGPTGGSET